MPHPSIHQLQNTINQTRHRVRGLLAQVDSLQGELKKSVETKQWLQTKMTEARELAAVRRYELHFIATQLLGLSSEEAEKVIDQEGKLFELLTAKMFP